MQRATLGLGLIGIGRSWGHVPQPPCSEEEARALLDAAFGLGIRFFDTAPAYGDSEARLGAFLRTLSRDEREATFVATKFGEHWQGQGAPTRVDHSYEALMRSLDRSVELLRDIDLLQVHKASVEALRNPDLKWALEAARAMDIPRFGASVSDAEAARMAIDLGVEALQFPLNALDRTLEPIVRLADDAGVEIITNRPLASGAALAGLDEAARLAALGKAYAEVLAMNPAGVVLMGTRSPRHLHENAAAFRQAQA